MKPPMDKTIYTDAEAAKKEVGALETVDEQLKLFEAIDDTQASKALVTTIDELEKAKREGKDPVEDMIKAYAAGDEAALLAEMAKAMKEGDADTKAFLKKVIDDRNVLMVDRLLERVAKQPGKTYLVAVGAAHYPGEMGILKLLEAKGKKARRVAADEKFEAKKAAEPAPTK
jgi:uncharacterized protein YbaP (TraB family)